MRIPLELKLQLENEETLQEFVDEFQRIKWIREELVAYLKTKLKRLQEEADKIENYNCPNYDKLQEDYRGQRRAYRQFIELLGGEKDAKF